MPRINGEWLPRFTGSDGERDEFHMNDFYYYFGIHHVDDDSKDLMMKLFPTTLHRNARKWYENLPDTSITNMGQLEETFLKKWGIRLEDMLVLIKIFEHIKQYENETLKDCQSRFEGTLCYNPKIHHPKDEYIVHLYTHVLLVHLGFPLNKRHPRTLNEDYSMDTRIEENISLSGIKDIFTSGTLSMEILFSHENFIDDFQEEGEQTIIQHRIVEDMTEEMEPEKNVEVSTYAPPSDEAIQDPVSPTQQKDDEVSCCTIKDKGEVHEDETITHVEKTKVLEDPSQEEIVSYPSPLNFDNFLLYDLEKEEETDKHTSVLNTPCYDTDTDIVDIDEFIHVGRHKWDVIDFDMDPIYDIKNHSQIFPS
jgi:hypothetical protein